MNHVLISDHDMVLLRINLSNVKHGDGVWKMNLSVIESVIYNAVVGVNEVCISL